MFGSFTRLSKGLAGLLCIGYVVGLFVPTAREVLALVPGRTIPWVWNVVTGGYLEQSIVSVVINCAAVLLIGRVLEPIWGSREFLKFVAIINLATGCATFALCIALYPVTQLEAFLYEEISGFHAVLAAFLVALKQLIPDQEITVFFVITFRAKHAPITLVLASIVLAIVGGITLQLVPFIVFGSYFGWIYLRFFQTTGEDKLRGDPSDEFAFVTFFPEFVRPAISPIATICNNLCCLWWSRGTEDGVGHVLGGKPLPGSDPVDASRRRERGARALEERLLAAKQAKEAKEAGSSESPTLPVSTDAKTDEEV